MVMEIVSLILIQIPIHGDQEEIPYIYRKLAVLIKDCLYSKELVEQHVQAPAMVHPVDNVVVDMVPLMNYV